PAGTGTVMLESPQALGVPSVPLKVIVLAPCVAPKFEPVTVTESLMCPVAGVTEISVGYTVNARPLLSTPLACTTTFPVVAPVGTGTVIVVAFQLVGDPVVPLNLTVLL